MRHLWREEASQYKREGYCIARGILPKTLVLQVFSDMHSLVAQQLKRHGLPCTAGNNAEDVHRDLQTLFARDLKAYLDTLTLWVPFVDVDRNLFTMDVIPGSHKGGLYSYKRRNHIFEVDPEHYDAR